MIADNFDLDLHTPNGKAATHSLAIIEIYPMFNHNNDSQESDEFERIKWKQMSDPIPGNEFPITHYNGADGPPLVQVPQAELPEEFISKQIVSWNRADEADLTLLQDLMSVKGCPEYNGYMTGSSREQDHALLYLSLFILTGMLKEVDLGKAASQEYIVLTLDQQLCRVALHVLWNDPNRFPNFFLRLGGMHLLRF